MSEKGEKHWHYGKKWNRDVIKKLHKPHPSMQGTNNPSKRQDVKEKLSEKKKQWWKDHPDFAPTVGRKLSKESKLKISRSHIGENNANYGKRWYNNGIQSVMAFECPEGYVLGRLMKGSRNG